ncbi:MAG TPA: hypothetical protein G4N95_05550 [Anaerolineae bacterium]|nr:hypothetical protein [Anaerolineae bacterium]
MYANGGEDFLVAWVPSKRQNMLSLRAECNVAKQSPSPPHRHYEENAARRRYLPTTVIARPPQGGRGNLLHRWQTSLVYSQIHQGDCFCRWRSIPMILVLSFQPAGEIF